MTSIRAPLRSLVHKVADVQVAALRSASRLAGPVFGRAAQLRGRGVPTSVADLRELAEAGASGAASLVDALTSRRGASGPKTGTPAEALTGTPTPRAPRTGSGHARPVRLVEVRGEAESHSDAAVAAGAPGTATGLADEAGRQARSAVAPAGESPAVDLPIENYDGQTVGALRPKLRALDVEALVRIRGYEQAHANRVQILTMIENRIARLRRSAPRGPEEPGGGPEPGQPSGSGAR